MFRQTVTVAVTARARTRRVDVSRRGQEAMTRSRPVPPQHAF